ncbi:MAG: glycerol-3-phosphate acyltransferase [Anaerolineales bacterium]
MWLSGLVIVLSYIIGSIPFGWIIVWLATRKDVRTVASGRTGGTNAMRAAGFGAGLATAILDILKGASTVWLARAITDNPWIHILAPLAAIIGHNYSIFLMERKENGGFRLRGGAGGAPCAGGAFGLWPWTLAVIIPLGALIFFGVGYASVTTMSIALIAILVFLVRAIQGLSPWQYVLYGVIAEGLLLWALRPNIQALREGRERFHGWRPWKKKNGE